MLKDLLLIRLQSLFNISFSKKSNGKTKVSSVALAIAVYSLLGLCFGFMSLSIAMILAEAAIVTNTEWLYFTVFNTISFSMIFMFSIFETKSVLFDSGDNELLLSMPISPRDIVFSRIITVLIINYAECAVMMIPAIAVFCVFGGGIVTLIGSTLVALIIPLFATSLSVAVGYLVAVISKKFKNNSLISVITSVIFLAVYFAVYSQMMNGLTVLEEDPEGIINQLSSALGIARGIGEASLLKPIPFIVLTLVSAASVVLIFYFTIKNYTNIITKTAKTNKTKYVKKRLVSQSAFVSLAKKEMQRFLSSSSYILNGAIGSIMQIAVGALILFQSANIDTVKDILSLIGLSSDGDVAVLLTALSIIVAAMNITSASALSLEGNCLWILGSSPVRTADVALAKLVPHIIISVPASFVTSVLMIIAARPNALGAVLMLVIPIIASLVFAMLGLIINILLPKFEFDNEVQVIKQSAATGITMLAGMFIGILSTAVSFVSLIYLTSAASFLILLAWFAVLFAALSMILMGPCLKKLDKIICGR